MIKNISVICIILMFLVNCKEHEKDKAKTLKDSKIEKKTVTNDTIKEIYIGKHFVAGGELNYYLVEESKDFKNIDSLSYSIYKSISNNDYIFSLEKFLKDEDVAEYEIIDTVNLKSKKIEVKIEELTDYKTLNLLVDKKLVKKWEFKTYPKKEQDNINGNIISKKTSIFNSWVNDENYIPEIHITNRDISYLFHGQCIYFFPIKTLNDNEVELIWRQTGRDCIYEVFFDETFDLPKNKIPQKGKPFAKYKVDNEVLKVTYFYEEWVEKYKNKITEDDKPFPFLKSFILKKE